MAFAELPSLPRGRDMRHSPMLRAPPVVSLPQRPRPHRALAPRPRSAFPELDCIRDRFSPDLIAAVARRARAIGVGADRVLIAAGVMDEEDYLLALCRWFGLGYETFEDCARETCPLDDLQLAQAAKTGLLLLRRSHGHVFVVAPRSVRDLLDYAADNPVLNFRLTSRARLNAFIARSNRAFMGRQAAEALNVDLPHLSAASRHPGRWLWLAATACVISAVLTFSEPALVAAEIALSAAFLAWLLLRLIGSSIARPTSDVPRIPDDELPVYTIIAALYREASSVQQLVTSIRQLDYPGIMAQTPQAFRRGNAGLRVP
jgi:hypothetical protein